MSVNGSAYLALRCWQCNAPADASLLDGRPVCGACSPQRPDFSRFSLRVSWFVRAYREAEALPAWWIMGKFLQTEYQTRRAQLKAWL